MTNNRRGYDMSKKEDRLAVYEMVRRVSEERGNHETARYYAKLMREDGEPTGLTPPARPRIPERLKTEADRNAEIEEIAEQVEPVLLSIVEKTKGKPHDSDAAKRQADEAAQVFEGGASEWQAALGRWGLSEASIALDDPNSSHPFAIAFWNGEPPSEWTRADARAAHAAWQRKAARDAKEQEARRLAGLASQGLTEGDVAEEEAAMLAQAKDEKRDTDLYVECASQVLSAWRDKGADMRGVRFDENGLLKPTSKGVRWLRAFTQGKEPKRVRETAKRLAEKQRGWRQDFEAFRQFK